MWALFLGITINCVALAFAVGYNMGADKSGDLKRFNESKDRYLSGSIRRN